MGKAHDDKINYFFALLDYMNDMELYRLRYKNNYDREELNKLNYFARKITKIIPPKKFFVNGAINEEMIITFFIESLRVLKSKEIEYYFEEKTKQSDIKRDPSLDQDDGRTVFKENFDGHVNIEIKLPTGKLTIIDEMIYAHEMGHIPEIENPRDSFLEYREVVPIFLEYLILLKRYRLTDAKEFFISERISRDIEHAYIMKYHYKNCDRNSKEQQLYAVQELVDAYKYLESTDFVLQLIDIFEKDISKVKGELEDFIEGKSLIEVASDLDIDTNGCKKLLKEYQNFRKR